MTEQQFGEPGSDTAGKETGFEQSGGDKSSSESIKRTSENDGISITPDDLTELRKRDENAQQHIPRLEDENMTLRNEVAELKNNLASSATLDDVMARLGDAPTGDQTSTDPDQIAAQVEQRLQRKAQDRVEQSNWDTVYAKLIEQHGTWENADKDITARCAELSMDPEAATQMARTSPEAFTRLFNSPTTVPQQTAAGAATTQTLTTDLPGEGPQPRTKEWYQELRKKNENKYWSEETQLQYRLDRESW